uniref:uncharacterized protein n=1 Tax=Pristiophorus japonicus TaxID=55135 RepID=UPI00398F8356
MRKISHNCSQQRRTGGGPPVIQTLTDIEEHTAALVGAYSRAVTTRGVAGPSHASRLPAPEVPVEDTPSHAITPLRVSLTTGGEEETTKPEEEEEYLETEEDAPCIPLSVEPAATIVIPTEEVPATSGMQLVMPRHTLVPSQTPQRPDQRLEQRPILDDRVERLARLCEESVAINRAQLQVFVGFTKEFSRVSARQAEAMQQMIHEMRENTASSHALRHPFLAAHGAAPQGSVTTSTSTQADPEEAPPPDSEGDSPCFVLPSNSPSTGDCDTTSPTTAGSLAIAHCTPAS